MNVITPPDLQRCQAESREAHGPFVLGPRPAWKRCTKRPRWVAVEADAKRGAAGCMSLCGGCRKILAREQPTTSVKYVALAVAEAAYKLGGPAAVAAIFKREGVNVAGWVAA